MQKGYKRQAKGMAVLRCFIGLFIVLIVVLARDVLHRAGLFGQIKSRSVASPVCCGNARADGAARTLRNGDSCGFAGCG